MELKSLEKQLKILEKATNMHEDILPYNYGTNLPANIRALLSELGKEEA